MIGFFRLTIAGLICTIVSVWHPQDVRANVECRPDSVEVREMGSGGNAVYNCKQVAWIARAESPSGGWGRGWHDNREAAVQRALKECAARSHGQVCTLKSVQHTGGLSAQKPEVSPPDPTTQKSKSPFANIDSLRKRAKEIDAKAKADAEAQKKAAKKKDPFNSPEADPKFPSNKDVRDLGAIPAAPVPRQQPPTQPVSQQSPIQSATPAQVEQGINSSNQPGGPIDNR